MYSVERTEEKPVICEEHLQGVLKVHSVFFLISLINNNTFSKTKHVIHYSFYI